MLGYSQVSNLCLKRLFEHCDYVTHRWSPFGSHFPGLFGVLVVFCEFFIYVLTKKRVCVCVCVCVKKNKDAFGPIINNMLYCY